jgi:hypothetical protein
MTTLGVFTQADLGAEERKLGEAVQIVQAAWRFLEGAKPAAHEGVTATWRCVPKSPWKIRPS